MNYEQVKKIIQLLKIPHQSNGVLSPFILTPDQERVLKLLVTEMRLIVLKGRQIGTSTLVCAWVAIWCIANPGGVAAVLAHDLSQAKFLTRKIASFLSQLEIKLVRASSVELELANKSEIHVITAISPADGESKTGRGKTFGLIYCSEAAFYRDSEAVFASITASATSNGQIILESTATPGAGAFKSVWENNRYTKVFCSTENHPRYQLEKELDDEELALARELGFSRTSAAAWWFNKLNTDLVGNTIKMLREYPVREEHAWTVAEGRWIPLDTPVLSADSIPTGHGTNIKQFKPFNRNHHYLIGVDPAGGAGGDDAVIIVWDMNDRCIAASWSDNTTPTEKVVNILHQLNTMYQPSEVFVEKNGPGLSITDQLRQLNFSYKIINTTAESKFNGMNLVRQWCMQGGGAGEDFLANVKSCRFDEKNGTGKFSGKKDLLMALGFILHNEEGYKYLLSQTPTRYIPPGHFDASRMLNEALERNRKSRW